MTVHRLVTLTCDGCGEVFDPGCVETVEKARFEAEVDGWHLRNGKDYCPRHYGYWWHADTGWVYSPSISLKHARRADWPYFLPESR